MLLNPQPGERILEIGTGSGYQAAVLCELGARVFSVERHRPLFDRTRKLLEKLGYRVVTRLGDGTQGWATVAPFDGIIVTAGATEVPDALLQQLRRPDENYAGGRLIIPVGDRAGQQMLHITCVGPDSYEQKEMHSFRFVPLVDDSDG
jgi:protein-L-isoaspartate(D-aspartate) O-methyltransferase